MVVLNKNNQIKALSEGIRPKCAFPGQSPLISVIADALLIFWSLLCLFIYYQFLVPLLLLELLSYCHALNGHSSVLISGSARV